MRLDIYLKTSRLIARRSLAQDFCDAGLIKVNGISAKSSKEIKVGDEIMIERRSRRTLIKVRSVPETKQVSKQAAGELYEVVEDQPVDSA